MERYFDDYVIGPQIDEFLSDPESSNEWSDEDDYISMIRLSNHYTIINK